MSDLTSVWSVFIGTHSEAARLIDPSDLAGVISPSELETRGQSWTAPPTKPKWIVVGTVEEIVLERVVPSLRFAMPRARLAMLGPSIDSRRCERWIRRGAEVYATDDVTPVRLKAFMVASESLDALVVDGVFQSALAAGWIDLIGGDALTEREKDILRHLQLGRRNREIAKECFISIHTVEFHLRNVYAKLGVGITRGGRIQGA